MSEPRHQFARRLLIRMSNATSMRALDEFIEECFETDIDAALSSRGWCDVCEMSRVVQGKNPGSEVRCDECAPAPDCMAMAKARR